MDFNKLSSFKEFDFKGFKSIEQLMFDNSIIPKEKGVYIVLLPKIEKPSFIKIGTGGYFKDRNPNVSIDELEKNWVDNTYVIYIGKAGSLTGGATLHSRLRQYLQFGQGKKIGHWGGRLIWQLRNHRNLLLCWLPIPNNDPREVELMLLQKFLEKYSKLPFANLTF